MKPTIAIVGRPNVGKSTLFNRLTQSKQAIVDKIPGVTRDRIFGEGKWNGWKFNLIDTGGFDDEDDEIISKVRSQIEIAINEADIIFALFDGRSELSTSDLSIIDILRKIKDKEILYISNKIDDENQTVLYHDLYKYGVPHIIPISAEHNIGINEIFNKINPKFRYEEEISTNEVKLAIIGRSNVGKSSLLNRIVGSNRVIVHDKPGTTRDSIHTRFEHENKDYIMIDTAGIRKRKKLRSFVDKIAILKAYKAIEEANIVMLLIDGSEGVRDQDTKISGFADHMGRGVLILVNKSDLIPKDVDLESMKKYIHSRLKFLDYAPLCFVSALTGKGIDKIFPQVEKIRFWQNYKLKTKELNRFLKEILRTKPPSQKSCSRIKLSYICQTGVHPPHFVIMSNKPALIHFSYKRFLINSLRKRFNFYGNPIVLTFR